MSPLWIRVIVSAAFGLIWTGAMLWWAAPLDLANTVITVVTGALFGLLWFWYVGRRGPAKRSDNVRD
jgi:hypothetical protein